MSLSRRKRIAIAAAPLFGAVGLLLGHVHAFGAGDRGDAVPGAVIGCGIGIALTALVFGRRKSLPRDDVSG